MLLLNPFASLRLWGRGGSKSEISKLALTHLARPRSLASRGRRVHSKSGLNYLLLACMCISTMHTHKESLNFPWAYGFCMSKRWLLCDTRKKTFLPKVVSNKIEVVYGISFSTYQGEITIETPPYLTCRFVVGSSQCKFTTQFMVFN